MNKNYSGAIRVTALMLVFALLQLYAGTGLAAIMPQGGTGKLYTRGNQPVTVNGNPTQSGATILTGSTIETGDQVGASIRLQSGGVIDLAPNTKIKVEFGNGQVKVTLTQGCLIVRVPQGIYGEVDTDKGKAAGNDALKRETVALDVCYTPGAPSPIVNQGAAANAGAGALGSIGVGAGGLNKALLVALFGGGSGALILGLILASRGRAVSRFS